MRLSTNFHLRELTASQTADREGIDNTPNKYEIANLQLLVDNVLQPIRNKLGVVSVSSGFRCVFFLEHVASYAIV